MNLEERTKVVTDSIASTTQSVTFDIVHPVNVDGVDQTSFTMRRPTVSDLIAFNERPESETARELWLIARLANVAHPDLERMDLVDFDLCRSVILTFRSA